jgi:molybdopterin synthase catalytic subunit
MLAEKAIEMVKASSNIQKMGMIAVHLGIVRSTSRSGEQVSAVDITYDKERLEKIIEDISKKPGIFEVVILTNEGKLKVGDEIMAVAVGGDIRENVFGALEEAVNRIKAEAAKKVEEKGGSNG